jgi:hypothetical protein
MTTVTIPWPVFGGGKRGMEAAMIDNRPCVFVHSPNKRRPSPTGCLPTKVTNFLMAPYVSAEICFRREPYRSRWRIGRRPVHTRFTIGSRSAHAIRGNRRHHSLPTIQRSVPIRRAPHVLPWSITRLCFEDRFQLPRPLRLF